MMRLADHPRRPGRLARALALASSLLILVGVVLVGAHRHERGDSTHACAICSLGHAPAAAPVLVVGSIPTPRVERVLVDRALTPMRGEAVSAVSRAPPSA